VTNFSEESTVHRAFVSPEGITTDPE
jgi:hypothetical protein